MTTPDLPVLWLAPMNDPLPADAMAWLDRSERDRLARGRSGEERGRRATAWCLRRWALSRLHPEIPMADWRFETGRDGKPELAAGFTGLGLHHSLSHGGDYAAVLIAREPCGVDVEGPVAGLEAMEVAFSPAERMSVLSSPDPHRAFLQLWVAKEALLKRHGSGFAIAPDSVTLVLSGDGRSARAIAAPADTAGSWQVGPVALWPVQGGHWLAAALGALGGVPDPVMASWHSPA